ncbi:hypothetical protein [Massilia sp. DJPM01]|uniref:hypothetical protein n=1 Tax=Massilia sp. DJPM01 TaxID=3024404 RepID=UPI0035A2F638
MDAGQRATAIYTNLPPGTWRFEVQARYLSQEWGPGARAGTDRAALLQRDLAIQGHAVRRGRHAHRGMGKAARAAPDAAKGGTEGGGGQAHGRTGRGEPGSGEKYPDPGCGQRDRCLDRTA